MMPFSFHLGIAIWQNKYYGRAADDCQEAGNNIFRTDTPSHGSGLPRTDAEGDAGGVLTISKRFKSRGEDKEIANLVDCEV